MNKFSKGKSISILMLTGMLGMSVTAVAQPMSGSFTINAGQATGGTNFASFNDAINALSTNGINASVVFNVAPGIFNEQVIIPEITGASVNSTITFNGNNATLLYNSTNTAQRAVVKLDGADFVTLRNLSVQTTNGGNNDYGYGIQLINGAEYNTIVRCNISVPQVVQATPVNNFAGIVINSQADAIVTPGNSNCNFNIIDSSVVSGGYHGISLVGDGSNFQIRGNIVRNSRVLDFFNAGVYLNGNDGAVVDNNEITRPNRSTGALFYGVQLYNRSKNVSVTRNRIHDPFGGTSAYVASGANGIYLVDAQAGPGEENIIANNIIYSLRSTSVIRAIWLGNTTSTSIGSSYYKIIHNTISLDDTELTGFSTATGIESSLSAQNGIIQNNSITIKRVGANFNTRIGMSLPSTNNIVDHNNIFIAPGSTNYVVKWGSVNCTTITDWQNNSGDNTSVSEDPQFGNPAAGDLLPANISLQAGEDINITGITTDISGLGRNTIPTMGAFEIDGTVLPVRMSLLSGKLNADGSAALYWSTFSEINNAGFTIQKSEDGKHWSGAGFVASQAEEGNSNFSLSYHFNDAVAISGKTFYRLEQSDRDGKTIYSNVVALNPGGTDVQNELQVYPNPAGNFIRIMSDHTSLTGGMVTILDYTGKTFLKVALNPGDKVIDIAGLPAGNYLLIFNDGQYRSGTRFVKVM